ncbi:zinc finger CW-type PWWP domain protein 1-like [Elysia marginata]|uniref:Zinc finger CW-type PWWP domain protein 1-like n=1 Tax=Elysia marginata TaxID=1093978 RepID=A0AAV4I7J5_9GAST|nr:zinc finger CW-type PWWP domain protein 1-like [Elysia marginata]
MVAKRALSVTPVCGQSFPSPRHISVHGTFFCISGATLTIRAPHIHHLGDAPQRRIAPPRGCILNVLHPHLNGRFPSSLVVERIAPLKAKDGFKPDGGQPSSVPFLQKTEKYVGLSKDEKHTEQNGLKIKEHKKVEKRDTPAPPRSLSDAEYDDLFHSVLQRVMVDNGNEQEATAQTKEMSEDVDDISNTEENEPDQIAIGTGEKSDKDADSIASEDVDEWADSPLISESDNKRDLQSMVKPKSALQKKAERKGVLKPKQLIVPETDNKNGCVKEESVLNKKKGTKSIDIKPPISKGKRTFVLKAGDLAKVKKIPEENRSKGLKDKTEKKKNNEERGTSKSEVQFTSREVEECTEEEEEEEKGTWIQCSKRECGKWRYVAGIEDPILVPTMWECKMNPDEEHNACDLPEVDFDESEHICTDFTIGSLVWAKMDGYPWWPGMVEADPDFNIYFELLTEKSMYPFQYHVTFFDDHVTRAWIKTISISPYIKGQQPGNKMSKGRHSYKKEIQQAIANADKALSLSLQERISMFGFLKRFNKKPRKVNQPHKAKSKYHQQLLKEIKTGENMEKVTQSQHGNNYNSSEDSSDLNDLSDVLEDTEYKPVKTKSRGSKVATENEDSQTLELEARSMKQDVRSEENKTESSEDTCPGESEDMKRVETKLDPDIFTMELDSTHVDHPDTVDKNQCKSSDYVNDCDMPFPDDIHLKDKNEEKAKPTPDETAGINKKREEVSSNEDQNQEKTKKRSKCKLALKTKTPKQENLETPKLIHNREENLHESNNDMAIKDNGSNVNSNVNQTKENNQENKKKTKSKLAIKSKTVDATRKDKARAEEEGTSMSKDKDLSGRDDDGGVPNSSKKAKIKNKLHTKQANHITDDSTKECKELRIEEGGKELDEKQRFSGEAGFNLTNSDDNITNSKQDCTKQQPIMHNLGKDKQEKALKTKGKNAKRTKSECDSDKENLEPSDTLTIKEEKCKKKKLKRQTNTSTCSIATNSSEKNSHTTGAKKFKLCLTSDNSEKTAPKDKVTDQEDCKQTKDKVKVSKRMLKSFAAPAKVLQTSDREVPELSLPCSKKDCQVKGGRLDSKSTKPMTANDQHVVPDMSQESVTEAHLDIDMFHETEKGKNKFAKLTEEKTTRGNNNVTMFDDSEEEELDLDINVPKVDFSLPQKFLSDSDDSDAEEMESDLNQSKVIVEEVKDNMKDFGRFASRCTDHGSESDPMELIED